MDFTDQQIDRYARHLVLPEIGEEGQQRLLGRVCWWWARAVWARRC